MRNLVLGLAAATALSGAAITVQAQPSSLLLRGVDPAHAATVEKAQWLYGGRNYCWYDDAWNGPGFYYCGYAWNRGWGWGGGYGWHGWRGGYGGGGYRGYYGGGRGGYGGGYGGGRGGYGGGHYNGRGHYGGARGGGGGHYGGGGHGGGDHHH